MIKDDPDSQVSTQESLSLSFSLSSFVCARMHHLVFVLATAKIFYFFKLFFIFGVFGSVSCWLNNLLVRLATLSCIPLKAGF